MASTPDVAKQIGATLRQLNLWTSRGILDGPVCAGPGHTKKWTPEEIAVAARMVCLIKAGLTPQAAGKIAAAGPGTHTLAPGVTIELEVS